MVYRTLIQHRLGIVIMTGLAVTIVKPLNTFGGDTAPTVAYVKDALVMLALKLSLNI